MLREPAPLAALEHHPWHTGIIVALVCTGAFIGQLDATIVQLALPSLGRSFDAPLEAVSWVSLAYLVAFAAFLPVFGRLCQMFGRKSLYLLGYLLFGVASALCGLAIDLPQLIAFRVLQGMGGAMLGAGNIAILVAAVDEKKRGRALGVFAAAQAVGMSAGPAVGGLVLAGLGWRWVFWLSVPFAIAAFVAGWLALPRAQATDRGQTFDFAGAALLGPALVCLVMALNHLSAWGPTSPAILGSIGAAGALLWLFVRQERRAPIRWWRCACSAAAPVHRRRGGGDARLRAALRHVLPHVVPAGTRLWRQPARRRLPAGGHPGGAGAGGTVQRPPRRARGRGAAHRDGHGRMRRRRRAALAVRRHGRGGKPRAPRRSRCSARGWACSSPPATMRR